MATFILPLAVSSFLYDFNKGLILFNINEI